MVNNYSEPRATAQYTLAGAAIAESLKEKIEDFFSSYSGNAFVVARLRNVIVCAKRFYNADSALSAVLNALGPLDTFEGFVTLEMESSHRRIASYIDHDDVKWFDNTTPTFHPLVPKPSTSCRVPFFFKANGLSVDLVNTFSGCTVFLVCNGPSLTDAMRNSLRHPGLFTCGLNNGAHRFRPNLWVALDRPSQFVPSLWQDPTIIKFVPCGQLDSPTEPLVPPTAVRTVSECPNVYGFIRNSKFSPSVWLNEPTINIGNHSDLGGARSVLLVALKLCFLLGFRRVFLVGCDFNMTLNTPYWFEQSITKRYAHRNNTAYAILHTYLQELHPHFQSADFLVFNTNPNSNLTVFPFTPLSEAIANAAIDLSVTTEHRYPM